jgi:hypothetical protein
MAISQTAFTGTGTSAAYGAANYVSAGAFNASLSGTWVGTVSLERGLPNTDGTLVWLPVTVDTAGATATYTVPVSFSVTEPEGAAQYRWNCTAYTSGTILARFGP